jgi:hypothetical protein
MADDEGAAYWEHVYGQPIHTFASARDEMRPNAQGQLERMTDDEYAAYVRQKMWEKTHAGLLEERAKKEREKEEKRERDDRARRVQAEIDASLQRSEERRSRRAWDRRWEAYLQAWQDWERGPSMEKIPWPLQDMPKEERTEKNLRIMFLRSVGEGAAEKTLLARLKEERVRWHPDKMQQRLGGQVDHDAMKEITATFQTIDKLWDDTRKTT